MTMKAAVRDRYGSTDVVRLDDVDRPIPGEDELLVRVHAASVNRADLDGLGPRPSFARLFMGLRRPRNPRLGIDVAGVVEAVGSTVTRFRPGDRVFADLFPFGQGAFAEYVAARETAFQTIPGGMAFEDAATLPHSAILAVQGLRLRDGRTIRPGDTVLVDGASGNVGPFAVQIAKSRGAVVTGVCSEAKLDFVRSLGVDQVEAAHLVHAGLPDLDVADATVEGRAIGDVGSECREDPRPLGIALALARIAPSGELGDLVTGDPPKSFDESREVEAGHRREEHQSAGMSRMPGDGQHRHEAAHRVSEDDRLADVERVAEGHEVVGGSLEAPGRRVAPRRPTVVAKVDVHQLGHVGQRGERGLEVGVVVAARSAVDQDERRALAHLPAIGHEAWPVDVEPQLRPIDLDLHRRKPRAVAGRVASGCQNDRTGRPHRCGCPVVGRRGLTGRA